MNDALSTFTITVYDSEGNLVEQWELYQAFIKSAKFGDLDYSNDELKILTQFARKNKYSIIEYK